MQVTVLAQPDRDTRTIGASVEEALRWNDARSAWFAVAWARRSGLTLLEPAIKCLRDRHRSVRALIGIDQHGSTEEALSLAMALFSEARVYHDSSRFKTFHPKLYVVEADGRARAVIGSGNLTEGGLSINYELALQIDLDLTDVGDATILQDFRAWFDRRWADRDASRRLTRTLIQRLLADPSVIVVREAEVPPPTARAGTGGTTTGTVFGPAVKGLRAPRAGVRSRAASSDSSDLVSPVAAGRRPPAAGRTAGPVARTSNDLVLAARLPLDRPGQAGFNAQVTTNFFGVSKNGDTVRAEAVDRRGVGQGMRSRRLVFPSGSNHNHRIELGDPERNQRSRSGRPIVLVRKLGPRRFRYLYLYPGDKGYASMTRQIEARNGVGTSLKKETKRVYLTLAEVRRVWPNCPL